MLRTALLVALHLLRPAPADACSQPPNGWWINEDGQHRSEVPQEGVILIRGGIYTGFEAGPSIDELMDFVTIDVYENGRRTPTPGSIEYSPILTAFVWRADQPLQPGSTYRVDYFFFPYTGGIPTEVVGSFTFDVRITDLPAMPPISLSNQRLDEWIEPKVVCCETGEGICYPPCGFPGEGPCQVCWNESFTYLPKLTADFGIAVRMHEPTIARIYASRDGGAEKLIATTELEQGARNPRSFARFFEEEGAEYCLQLEVERLVDGAILRSPQACAAHADKIAIDRQTPDFTNVAQCAELPEGYDLDGPKIPVEPPPRSGFDLATEDASCGCTQTESPAGPIVLLLLPLALLLRRRR